MAASASMLFGLPQFVWLTVITGVIVLLQILLSYHSYARILKYTCLALLAYVIVPFLKGSHNDWGAIATHLVTPNWSGKLDYQLAAVAFLGTTISPYLFFWQAGETVEEVVERNEEDDDGKRNCVVRESEVRNVRADTVLGMITSQLGAFFMVVAAAGTLHVNGHSTDINTAQDAAKALSPLGPFAVWLFSLGIIGCGMLAVPTLAGSAAYAVSEACGWRYGLYRKFQQAPKFYFAVIGVLLAGYLMNFFTVLSPVKALVYSAVANAIAAVPLIFVLMLLCNNKKILGERTNGIWSNLFGWLTFLFMGAASSFFVWAWATGKAS
jgi:Mn2+/Fe2+ NRAMP family transporter